MARRVPTPLIVAALLGLLVAACKPLYLPPVPESPTQPQHTRLDSSSALELVDGRPILTLVLAELVGPAGGDWLNVQWFGPSNVEEASDSAWVTSDAVGTTIEFALPADVAMVSGEWRATVSYAGRLLRQFRLDVVADVLEPSD